MLRQQRNGQWFLKPTLERPHDGSAARAARSFFKRPRAVLFLAFTMASGLLFHAPLAELVRLSLNNEQYSYILVIPFISAYFLYRKRCEISRHSASSLAAGMTVLSMGLVLVTISRSTGAVHVWDGRLTAVVSGVIVLWIGGFVLFFGLSAFRMVSFPLLLLVLLIPLPPAAIDRIIVALQHGSAEVASFLFWISGVPVYRDDLVFQLPVLSIEVAEECSGIRSSLSLLVTSLLAGQLFLESGWRRLVLSLSTLPIALFKNGLRIVSLTLLSIYVDPAFLSGNLHRHGGILFFALSLLMLAFVLGLLRKAERTPFGEPRRKSVVAALENQAEPTARSH